MTLISFLVLLSTYFDFSTWHQCQEIKYSREEDEKIEERYCYFVDKY